MNEQGAQVREEAVPRLITLAGLPYSIEPSDRRHVSLQEKNGSFLKRSGITSQAEREDAQVADEGEEQESRIYVFDREHLDADPETIVISLAITDDQVLSEPELGRKFLPDGSTG